MAIPKPKEINRGGYERHECPLLNGGEHAGILLDFCGRKLPPAVAAEMERHIAGCPACRDFAAAQIAVWNALDEFDALPVSEDFDRKLFLRIEREGQAGWLERCRNWITLGPIWRPALPVAVAVAVVGMGLWVRPVAIDRPAEPTPVAVKADKIDPEQLERALEDMEMLRQLGVVEALGQRQM